jgi:ketosteroid isomerase-like protein
VEGENVEALSRFYSAFNRGDLDGMIAELDPNFETKPSFGGHLEGGVFRGHEGFAGGSLRLCPKPGATSPPSRRSTSKRQTRYW